MLDIKAHQVGLCPRKHPRATCREPLVSQVQVILRNAIAQAGLGRDTNPSVPNRYRHQCVTEYPAILRRNCGIAANLALRVDQHQLRARSQHQVQPAGDTVSIHPLHDVRVKRRTSYAEIESLISVDSSDLSMGSQYPVVPALGGDLRTPNERCATDVVSIEVRERVSSGGRYCRLRTQVLRHLRETHVQNLRCQPESS